MTYYIYDELGLIRKTKSKTEAKWLTATRPDWKVVCKKEVTQKFQFEDAPF